MTIINEKFLSMEREAVLKLINNLRGFQKQMMPREYEEILLKQYKCAQIENRIFTKCGFYTSYKIPDNSCNKINKMSFELEWVEASINDGYICVGFILYIRNGYISSLECFENGSKDNAVFPDIINNYNLFLE